MKNSTLIKTVLIATGLSLFAGCVEREVVYRPAPGAVVVGDAAPAPPPPQAEVITTAPGPLELWCWIPGCWEWNGRWVWFGGHWVARPHHGAVWIGSHWDWRGHHRVWVRGGWR